VSLAKAVGYAVALALVLGAFLAFEAFLRTAMKAVMPELGL
jgi:hypothetical protein